MSLKGFFAQFARWIPPKNTTLMITCLDLNTTLFIKKASVKCVLFKSLIFNFFDTLSTCMNCLQWTESKRTLYGKFPMSLDRVFILVLTFSFDPKAKEEEGNFPSRQAIFKI